MSFTANVKNEVTELNTDRSEKISELTGFLRSSCKDFNNFEVYTENINIANRMFSFINEIYNFNCEISEGNNTLFTAKKVYYLLIHDNIDYMLKDLAIIDENGKFQPTTSQYIIGSLDEIKAYIRGSFLACGSINDPKTSQYHLEMLFDRKEESVFVQRLLNEFDLNAKILLRDKKYMVYIKDSDDISDFLIIIGANKAVMYYENIRAYKEQINITNRLNNCEQANTDKILMSSNEQIKDINLIVEKMGIEFLDDKLQEVVTYRLKYPEASLLELSEIITFETNKKITKSGLNHRFRKLKDIANRCRNMDVNE